MRTLRALAGRRIRVLHPPGLEDLAGQILEFTEKAYSEIRNALSLQAYPRLTIKLYAVGSNFRGSIWPDIGINVDLPYWTAARQSLKLLATAVDQDESLQPLLTESIVRHILTQSGLESEWLLRGAKETNLPADLMEEVLLERLGATG